MRSNQSSGTSKQKRTKIVASAQLAIGFLFMLGGYITYGSGIFVLNCLTTQRTDLTFGIKQDGISNYFYNPENPSFTPAQNLAALESLKTQGLLIKIDGLNIILYSSFLFNLSLIWIFLSFVLFEGAVKRDLKICFIWLVIKLVYMIVFIVILLMDVFNRVGVVSPMNWGIIAFMLLELYFMLIVLEFFVELHKEKRQQLRAEGDCEC